MDYVFYILAVGLVAGWLAGKIMKGKGFGLAGDLAVGVLGAFVGSWIFGVLGFGAYGIVGSIVTALIGSMLCIYIARRIKKH